MPLTYFINDISGESHGNRFVVIRFYPKVMTIRRKFDHQLDYAYLHLFVGASL